MPVQKATRVLIAPGVVPDLEAFGTDLDGFVRGRLC